MKILSTAAAKFLVERIVCLSGYSAFIARARMNQKLIKGQYVSKPLSGQWTGLLSTVNGNFHCLQL